MVSSFGQRTHNLQLQLFLMYYVVVITFCLLFRYTKPVSVQDFTAEVTDTTHLPDSGQSVILSLSEKLDNMTKVY